MREINPESLERAAKKVREIRMSNGDRFGTMLYETEHCAGPTAGEALQQMHDLSRDIADSAIAAYLAAEAERGYALVPREPTPEMKDAGAPRPSHWPAAGHDRDCDAALMADQAVLARKWRAMFDAAAGPDCLRKGPVETTAVSNEQSKSAPIKPSEKEG